jgi:2,4-dienoyl-CoA reductase-like NADH-dependent reductase (Old Yellow Enzyme family)
MELLFETLAVQDKVLRNRIVMPPMVVNRGITSLEGREWYARRARGGAALIIIEASDVVRFGSEFTTQNLKPLVNAIHAESALAAIQLFPGIRGEKVQPAQLAMEEIARLVQSYKLAAQICVEAGFDGIEPHGAHGFLLNQFFSPERNLRQDAYGLTITGRMRLALEIVAVVKPIAAQAGALLLYRHTPEGPGYGIAESLVLARELVRSGVDILDISPASKTAPADLAAPFMQCGVPVIAVNAMHRLERALETLREKRASLVAVGKGLIADPDWPIKVKEGRFSEIVECLECDECWEYLNKGLPLECSQWV